MHALLIAAALVCSQQRTFFTLPASNGWGAIVADTKEAKLVHFREHLPATEEPELDLAGNPAKDGEVPRVVKTRNLLFDAYFGLRVNGTQRWLQGVPVTESGYEHGIVYWKQSLSGVTLTTYAFAPRGLPHAGFVMLLHIEGAATAFSLHNFHLGYGRPTPGVNGETVVVAGNRDLLERAFAGVTVTRPLGPVTHALAWNPGSAANGYTVVQSTTNDFPDSVGDLGVADDWASGFQFAAGEWVGLAVVHHGDPFAGATAQGWLDAYVGGKSPQQLLTDERAAWAAFQQRVTLPPGLTADEEKVARQSAVMLAMAQVNESQVYLREFLTRDGEARRSAFSMTLPGQVTHRGAGQVLAALPPAEWTYAWVRDGAYALAAMAQVGLVDEAKRGVQFVADASQTPSLTRYTGFGTPEQDWNDFGPNVEYDGWGLTLWAMRKAGVTEGHAALADALSQLIDPTTGLMKKDSSIWETHTRGRERTWTYTNLTAVRGLCDAAAMSVDPIKAAAWRDAALALRKNIALKLTDANGALASNREELQSGSAYADAAVLDAFALGLFKADGRIGKATVALLDSKLKTPHGWSRNDDRTNSNGLSPWGSEYDSAEWVFTDLRGGKRGWTTANAAANAGVIPETYDEVSGAWKFNAPMVGFGAGAYLLSLLPPEAPACGVYFEDEAQPVTDAGHPGVDAGMKPDDPKPKGCGCGSTGKGLLAALAFAWVSPRRRRKPRAEAMPLP
ncbi:MAG: glycosyl hydrolase [Archangiaceae bacterium]|nr:glycosyl hydrolase [Archangiaceae bacterium]